MKARYVSLLALGAGLLILTTTGSTSALGIGADPPCQCTYSPPDLYNSGDIFYSGLPVWSGGNTWCSLTMFNLSSAYGMDALGLPLWPTGYGYLDCDISKPFGRTMNAITALRTASPNTITGGLLQYQTGLYPLLDWAYTWTVNKIDWTSASCQNLEMQAMAQELGGEVTLYLRETAYCGQAFFHGLDAAERAGTLVHEARHVDGPGHAGTAGVKDLYFGDGGAWEFEVTWLKQFGEQGSVFTLLLRCSALDRAKGILQQKFQNPPPALAYPDEC